MAATLREEVEPTAALLGPKTPPRDYRLSIVYGCPIMIAIVESPVADVTASSLVQLVEIGIEIRVTHGRQHGEKERIGVYDVHEIRIAGIQLLLQRGLHHKSWTRRIQTRNPGQRLAHIVGHHSSHLGTQTEANQVDILTSTDASGD